MFASFLKCMYCTHVLYFVLQLCSGEIYSNEVWKTYITLLLFGCSNNSHLIRTSLPQLRDEKGVIFVQHRLADAIKVAFILTLFCPSKQASYGKKNLNMLFCLVTEILVTWYPTFLCSHYDF